MIFYEDLLTIPYKVGGRDSSGMDCYGLVIECCRRANLNLHDAVYASELVSKNELADYVSDLGARRIDGPRENCIVQCEFNGNLHIGFMIDKCLCVHETYEGVRVTPVVALKNPVYFEVK